MSKNRTETWLENRRSSLTPREGLRRSSLTTREGLPRHNGYRFSSYGEVTMTLSESDLSGAFIGLYWQKRLLTLREFSEFVRTLLEILRSSHSVFSELAWVGNGKIQPIQLSQEMSSLDELVYRHSWSKQDLVGPRNVDGTATWHSENEIGFSISFYSIDSNTTKGILFSTRAGYDGRAVPNSVVLSFPFPDANASIPESFYDYDFILCLFSRLLDFTKATRGVVSSTDFYREFSKPGRCDAGWFTYVSGRFPAPNDSRILTEETQLPGTLFTLGKDSIFVISNETVDRARALTKEINNFEVGG